MDEEVSRPAKYTLCCAVVYIAVCICFFMAACKNSAPKSPIDSDPRTVEQIMQSADKLRQDGTPEALAKAVAELEIALAKDPFDPSVILSFGTTAMESTGNNISYSSYSKIDRSLRRLILLHPDEPLGYIALGRLHKSIRRLDTCVGLANEALKLSPGNVEALALKGQCMMNDDPDAAIKVMNESLKTNDTNDLRLGLAAAYIKRNNAGDAALAEKHLRVLLGRTPDDTRALTNLGWAMPAQGKFEDGIGICARAIEIDPEFYPALRCMGGLSEATGDFSQAEGFYHRASVVSPQDIPSVLMLARVREFQSKKEEAIAAYKEALLRDQTNQLAQDRLKALGVLSTPSSLPPGNDKP